MSSIAQTPYAVQPPHKSLTSGDKAFLVGFLIFVALFGIVVERRSAFMQRRMTDAGCYFRAAWAARAGEDIYEVTDDNQWHYNYPPLLAILLAPLADAPAGVERSSQLPYAVSVALWFLLNLACGAVGIHWLARTLETTSSDPMIRTTPVGCQAWWRRRIVPLMICLLPIGHSLMRGQVNLILLMVFAGMIAAHVRGRRFTAGAWLAAAICIKIIPAFLLVLPLWRRDSRFLAGSAAGLAVGLLLIPGVVMGPGKTLAGYRKLAVAVLGPGLLQQGDGTRDKELTTVTSTDNQSFVAVLHCTVYSDKTTRPNQATPWLRLTAMGAALALTLATLLAARKRLNAAGGPQAVDIMLTWGALVLTMLFCSPVSHMHYFAWSLPLVMGLLWLAPARGWALAVWLPCIVVFQIVHSLPHMPEWGINLRDLGLAMYGGLLCWLAAVAALLRPAPPVVATLALPEPNQLAA